MTADAFRISLLERIADQARNVRSCQRQFFQTKDRHALAASKVAEKELDALLATLAKLDGGP